MAPMRRSDRRDESHDNAIRHPRSRRSEPISARDLQSRLVTVRSQRDEAQQEAKAKADEAQHNHQLYLEEQEKRQSAIALYHNTKQEAESYLDLYNQEQIRSQQLLIQYEEAKAESQQYLALYQDAQAQLKVERRSKAGIKGWETRRKRENARLKREIADMARVLKDSLERKEEAIEHLEELANRMDRIQVLVDSVESEMSEAPLGLIPKMKRIWQAIQDILAE